MVYIVPFRVFQRRVHTFPVIDAINVVSHFSIGENTVSAGRDTLARLIPISFWYTRHKIHLQDTPYCLGPLGR